MLNENNILDTSTACPQGNADRRIARRARRAASLDSCAMEKQAAEFHGLPDGIKHHDALLQTFQKAAPAFGIPRPVLTLIGHLHGCTQPRDWQKGTRPLCWPSNQELMHKLACKPTAVGDAIRWAVKHGLMVMKDSPTGRRYGRRTETGAIDEERTFGFDLSPLALRYAEFKAAAEREQATHTARMTARRDVTRQREGLFQIIDTADELGLWCTYWEDMAKKAEDTRTLLTPTLPLAETLHLVNCLAQWREDARATLEAAVENPVEEPAGDVGTENESDSQLSDFRQLENSTDSTPKIDKSSIVKEAIRGSVVCPTVVSSPSTPSPAATRELRPEPTQADLLAVEAKGITPARIVTVCPVLAAISGPDPTWRDLGEACRRSAVHYELSHRTWARALAELGPQKSVIVFAMMTAFPPEHFTKSAGSWFASMISKHATGALTLSKLIAGFHGMKGRAESGAAPTSPPVKGPRSAYDKRAVGNIAAGLLARMRVGGTA